MNDVFGADYSSLYDAVYGDKDYPHECDAIESLLGRYGGSPSSILDLGCGTGGHALELAGRGYRVTGVDRSGDMIERARSKAGSEGVEIDLHTCAIQELHLDRTFDAALMMFAVFGYQITDEEAADALRAIRIHLDRGGILIFDVWFGPAVVAIGPELRQKDIPSLEGIIRKSSSAEIDLETQVATVEMDLVVLEGVREISRTNEVHSMRFFFPRELDLLLSGAGFRRLLLAPFPDIDTEVGTNTWNVVVAAEAV